MSPRENIDTTAKDEYNNTLLHIAILLDKPDKVRLFINRGANVRAKNKFDYGPLELARKLDRSGIVSLLKKQEQRRTLYKLDEIESLVDQGINVNDQDKRSFTPLLYAIEIYVLANSDIIFPHLATEDMYELLMEELSKNNEIKPLHCAIVSSFISALDTSGDVKTLLLSDIMRLLIREELILVLVLHMIILLQIGKIVYRVRQLLFRKYLKIKHLFQ